MQFIRQLPRNVWILASTLALVQGSMPLLVLVSGLLGSEIAPDKKLATLPVAVAVVGTACFTIPAILLAQRFGRKRSAYLGLSCMLLGISACGLATVTLNFWWLVGGSLLVGVSTAFMQQFRFAALESLSDLSNAGPALAILMLSGIAAGIIGPELVTLGSSLLPSAPQFLAAFSLMAGLIIVGMTVLTRFNNPEILKDDTSGEARALSVIIKTPTFMIAASLGTISFAVMVFLMTSTPISMHVMHGHSVNDAKWVIQSHVVAMFLPSVFSGFLVKRFGAAPLMITGSLLYLLVILVAFNGHQVIHYWWALVLLGIGWNFLFLSATTVLPTAYKPNERFKAQAANDFIMFTTQAISSLIAGWILFNFGWNTQLWLCLPVSILALLLSLSYAMQQRKPVYKPV